MSIGQAQRGYRNCTTPRLRGPRALFAVMAAMLLMVTAGCGGSSASSSSSVDSRPIRIGQTSIATSLDPYKSSWALTADGVSEYVFMLDPQGKETSRFVDNVTQVDDLDWTMTVKSGPMFSDGTPVDADALAACLNSIQHKTALSNASAGVITFTADGNTLKAHTQRTTKVLTSVLGEWTNVVFKTDSAGNYIYTGPYTVQSFTSGTELDLKPNPHYLDAAKRTAVEVKTFADADAMKLAIQSKSLDMAFTVTPAVADQLKQTKGLQVKSIDAGYQYFGRFNLKSGPLTDQTIRQAIDLGVNRNDYIQALQGGRIATGAFVHYYSFAGTEQLDTDTAKANALLDQDGWVKGSDGIREKNGTKLDLRLVTYASRPDLSLMMQVIVSQLKSLGIDAQTSIADNITATMQSGNYDLALWAQHTAPTGDPSFFLNQFFRTGAANNLTGYSSPITDGLLDQLDSTSPGSARDAVAIKIQHQLHDDEAMLYLVDPQWHIGLTNRLASYTPYCGDYYVVNPQLTVG